MNNLIESRLYDTLHNTWSLLLPLIPVIAAYFVYLRQKEHELVRRRYLDEGIDLLIRSIEAALSVFHYNYMYTFLTVDSIAHPKSSINRQLLPLKPQSILSTPVLRVKCLIKEDLVGAILIEIFWFVQNANIAFDKILLSQSTGQCSISNTGLSNDTILKSLMTTAEGCGELLEDLQGISDLLEKERFSFRSINKFHDRTDVIELRTAIKRHIQVVRSRRDSLRMDQ